MQGNGAATPIPGATVTVEGVVIANFQGTNKLQGFFLQEEDADADADPATSEGIFVFCGGCPTPVAEGQRVKATGTVSEFNNMTEITASTAPARSSSPTPATTSPQVTPSPIDLPIAGVVDDFYEAREGMKVTFVDTLTVSEYFELGALRPDHPLRGRPAAAVHRGQRAERRRQRRPGRQPRRAARSSSTTTTTRRSAYLTTSPAGPADGLQFVFYPRANGGFSVGTQGTDFFRGGDLVNGLTGVLHWSFPGFGADTWRIRPTAANPATFTVANPRPATPPAVGGAIKAVGMNLLNYFTTIDTTASTSTGPCGPSGTLDCRGADSVAELNRQRERASLVICTLNADVYGFAELENTTPSATITDLLGAVNARCGGAHPYAFVNTGGTLGTDAIRVQLIYRTGIVSPVGSPLVDLDPIHNRPPTAQTFDVVDAANPAFGQRFTVDRQPLQVEGLPPAPAATPTPETAQGCFNATRTAQANRLLTWINGTVLPAAGDPDVLLLGDFNSYAKEDPVNALIGRRVHRPRDRSSTARTPTPTSSTASSAISTTASPAPACCRRSPAPTPGTSTPTRSTSSTTTTRSWTAPARRPSRRSPTARRWCRRASSSSRARRTAPPTTTRCSSACSPVADLAITKTDGVTTATPGGSVTYTITASNAGPTRRPAAPSPTPSRPSSPAPGPAWAPAAAPARPPAPATSTTRSTCRPAAA